MIIGKRSVIIIAWVTIFSAFNLACIPLSYEVHHGPIAEQYLPNLIQFDAQFFNEWPYLFVPTQDYEHDYWSAISTTSTILVLAFDQETLVGALVALSAEEEKEGHKDAISKHPNYQEGKALNLAWIAVQPSYRAKGVARELVKQCETVACTLGYTDAYLVTVVRSQDHPLKPKNPFDLDAVWRRLGYKLTVIHELWLWPTRCATADGECAAKIDNMVQWWHKKLPLTSTPLHSS